MIDYVKAKDFKEDDLIFSMYKIISIERINIRNYLHIKIQMRRTNEKDTYFLCSENSRFLIKRRKSNGRKKTGYKPN